VARRKGGREAGNGGEGRELLGSRRDGMLSREIASAASADERGYEALKARLATTK